jgi:cell cycle checkpoint protein
MVHEEDRPVFSAVSGSARQLFVLLRCISFAPKTQVQISDEGLRFSVEESSVMEGMAFLEKSLFTSYHYTPPPPPSPRSDAAENEEEANHPVFIVSLPSLLETLQIFGSTAENRPNPFSRESYTHAFSNQVLGVSGLCRLGYDAPGSPLTIILEEQGIRTTCELNTYEPSFSSDIPFSREHLVMKVIMRASYLHDAIAELSANNPQVVTFGAKKKTFTLSASSPLGSAVVDFHRDAKSGYKAPASNEDNEDTNDEQHNQNTGLLETFLLATDSGLFSQSYKFAHIAATKKALQAATKVSIRVDHQGVLSLQFMIENLEGGGVSFVDFRFVPLVGEDAEEHAGENASEDETDEEAGEE